MFLKRHLFDIISIQIMRHQIFTLPNKISMSRICCIPLLVFCILQVQHNNHYRYACLFIMLLIGLSDVMDGYLARKRNEITELGKYIDPVADKLVLMTACVILSSDRIWPEPRFPLWIPTVIVGRDLLLMFGAVTVLIITGRIECQPIMPGKLATFFQTIAIISVLIGNHIPLPMLLTIWWTAATFTAVSGIFYLYRGVRQL